MGDLVGRQLGPDLATTAATPGTTAAITNVVRRPIASDTGPASAIETGIRLIETKKSSEATRPSRCGGTRRCSSVPQMTIGAEKNTPRTNAATTTTQTALAKPITSSGRQPTPHIRFIQVR